MGVSLAGFSPLAVVEWDKWACDTVRENKKRGLALLRDWPLFEGDVRTFDWSAIPCGIELVAGGPPCQPFSMGGKHQAFDDKRDMFPATVEIVRRLQPQAFIVENVKGLKRASFADYFEYILLQLEFPNLQRKEGEEWTSHLLKLKKQKSSNSIYSDLRYNVKTALLNAANYGVPQKRERVFIVGFRSDLNIVWDFPLPTHCADMLMYEQWISGEYWERHRIAKRNRPIMTSVISKRIKSLGLDLFKGENRAWRTVRDAFMGLPDPQSRAANNFSNHRFQPGARVYAGHTGSPLDAPAKTLKAGGHGVPGGENMLVNYDGSVRYFTIRESARLQTFPDDYVFHGSWTETMRQLGNAVPVLLSQVIASSVAEKLNAKQKRAKQSITTAESALT